MVRAEQTPYRLLVVTRQEFQETGTGLVLLVVVVAVASPLRARWVTEWQVVAPMTLLAVLLETEQEALGQARLQEFLLLVLVAVAAPEGPLVPVIAGVLVESTVVEEAAAVVSLVVLEMHLAMAALVETVS